MSWLSSILNRARMLKQAEILEMSVPLGMTAQEFSRELNRLSGSTLPDNPTINDFRIELDRLVQLAKIAQNETPGGRWPPEQYRWIMKHAEKNAEKMK